MSVFRQTRFTRNKDNSKMQTTSIFENEIKYDIPTIDSRPTMSTLSRRHKLDRHPLQSIISENEKSFTKYAGPADADGHDIRKDPSYTNFKVPFDMVCHERYNKVYKKYQAQFRNEINKLIDNQASAREATYFVRIVSYTTLWPPLHTERELVNTSRRFYRLTPEEESRFQFIMSNEFS